MLIFTEYFLSKIFNLIQYFIFRLQCNVLLQLSPFVEKTMDQNFHLKLRYQTDINSRDLFK
jgi:hypothetical protein